MKIQMHRAFSALVIVGIWTFWPAKILAAPANHLVISEVQTGSSSDASQEFVELYNPTATQISLDGWTLEYASSAGTTWTKKSTLVGSIPAYGFYLISTNGYLTSDATMTSGLAGTGGHVRIRNSAGVVVDTVGWGTATKSEAGPAQAPTAGGSIERLPGRLSEKAGNGEDTDDNGRDFIARDMAEPQSTKTASEDPASLPIVVPDPDPVEEPVIAPTYLPVTITELLPDPASPLSDAKDEYIEIYNPNNVAVNLKGYVLRTGTDFKSFYTIGDIVVDPMAYAVFYSVDTKLGLTNSGGAAQILDPLGNVLDVISSYTVAKTGQAWADINGSWLWTLELTPGAANVLSESVTKAASSSVAATKSSTKKSAVKKVATKKSAAKKISKASAKKAKSKVPKSGIAASTAAITEPSPLARWLLIGAGCFTIMYAIYGFRHDLYNYYIKSRRNIGAWYASRPALPWRRNN